jgi:hypothetical protein
MSSNVTLGKEGSKISQKSVRYYLNGPEMDFDSPNMASGTLKQTIMYKLPTVSVECYKAFRRFWQEKFPDGGSVLGSSKFSVLPQLPPKMMFGLKEVKIE